MAEKVFVYGTLRKGDERAHFLDGARLLGTRTLEGFDLFDLGSYPGVIHGSGTVVGELYELASDHALVLLDHVEGIHARPPLYKRISVEVEGEAAWLYVYAQSVANARYIESGDWLRQ